MRTIPGLENYLLPLEDTISKKFLPDLLGRPIKPEIRELISLPPRLEGMGIISPIKAAVEEFKNSVCLTKQLAKKIVQQDKDGSINKDSVKEARREIAKHWENDQQEELQKILGGKQLGLYKKKRIEACLEKDASNWLSPFYLKEAGFSLNKLEFIDAIALQYELPVPRLPDICACGDEFISDHEMIYKTCGFVSLRHNELSDLTGNMLMEACRNVEVEPLLQPLTGEKLRYQTSIKEDNALLDLSALGFWRRGEKAFFDKRVFDPVAQSHLNQNLQVTYLSRHGTKARSLASKVKPKPRQSSEAKAEVEANGHEAKAEAEASVLKRS